MVIILTAPRNDFRDSLNIDNNFILVSHARQLSSDISNNQTQTNRQHQVEAVRLQNSQDSPKLSRGEPRRNQEAASMRVNLPSMKRSAIGSNETRPATQNTKKKFKTSGKVFASSSRQTVATDGIGTRQEHRNEMWRNQANDTNNNSIEARKEDDINNNIEPPGNWRRSIDSVNGTVDVSLYERNDIDRLYGDALLVYFKNFNE